MPQLLQHALRGHGLRSASEIESSSGADVPGTIGPHSVPSCGGGIGGVPVLRHILYPTSMPLHSVQAQVLPLLNASMSSAVMPYWVANLAHVSPSAIRCAAQLP